jgi:hypothetical protein
LLIRFTKLTARATSSGCGRGEIEQSGPTGSKRRRREERAVSMRTRIISTTVVLALGLLGVTVAQQGDREEPRTEREEQRSQVAKLRAEVELLELEHKVNAGILTKLMTDIRNWDSMEAVKGPMQEQLKALKQRVPAPPTVFPQLFPGNAGGEVVDQQSLVDEAAIKVARPVLNRMRKDFLQEATQLNEKRLRLAEAEKRYNAAK